MSYPLGSEPALFPATFWCSSGAWEGAQEPKTHPAAANNSRHKTFTMTKFCGEAINSRSGRKRATYTSKELKKDMEVFLQTGVHPHLQRVQADPGSNDVLTALPDPDPTRPHVFMDVTVDNKPAGRLVIELFEDVAPAAARHLLNRCTPGAGASLQGALFHKLLAGFGLFGGKSSAALFPGGQQVPSNSKLKTTIVGAVSVSRDGSDFAISLNRALKLDDTHQVVGRVSKGLDVLELLGDVPCGPDDSPLMRLKIAKCGPTNAEGTHESLDESRAKETPEEAAARLKQQSADTRSAVMDALQEGMGHKRSAAEAGIGPSSSAAAAAAAGGEAAAGSSKPGAPAGGGGQAGAGSSKAGGANKRSKKMLDDLLDDLDDDGSESEDSEQDSQGG